MEISEAGVRRYRYWSAPLQLRTTATLAVPAAIAYLSAQRSRFLQVSIFLRFSFI